MTRRLIGCLLSLGLIPLVATPVGEASTYTNPTPITIAQDGVAAPYPSTISVSGLPDQQGRNLTARVTLIGFSHEFPDDVDMLLVGPEFQEGGVTVRGTTLLMSDACGDPDLTGVNLTFDDNAASGLPNAPPPPCTSGSFNTTDFEPGDPFPPPAPPPMGSYGIGFGRFGGFFPVGPPNGSWQLYVVDDLGGFAGSIAGGWSLELLPNTAPCGSRGNTATAAAEVGTAGNDVLRGSAGRDVLFGLDGNDTITGLGGNDVICGGRGNDALKGGSGRDYLRGEQGRDKLKGQGGRDVCNGGARKDTAKACEKVKDL